MKSKIESMPATGPFGHLRWYDTPEIDDARTALLGRLAALYAYGTKTRELYSLEVLKEPLKRSNLLRTVTNWVETYPSRTVSRRLVALCVASPGVNAEMLEKEPFNFESLEYWYKWELDRQDARELLMHTLAKIWAPMRADLAPLVALGIPSSKWEKLRKMEILPSLDVERCLNQALKDTQKSFEICDRPYFETFDELIAYYQRPEKKAIQEAFTKAWKAEERRLLEMTPKARDKEYELEGV